MSSNLRVTSILVLAVLLLVLLVAASNVHTAHIVATEDFITNRLEIFESWLDLLRSALFERDNDAKKSEASFEELKDSIGGHLMAMYGQDMDALDVLKEFLLLTRVKFLLHNDGNRLNLEDIYRAGEKMITAMREHLPMKLSRGTMCEFSHSAKDHFDGEEVHIFLARLLKQLNWKGMHIEQSLSDVREIVVAQWESLRQQSE